jgi:hypothetical protein
MRASREQRAERLAESADKARAKGAAAYGASAKIAERFYGGQPILIGHHSEKGARRDHERSDNLMRKAIAEDKRADDLDRRAEAAANNTAIYADAEDPVAEIDARIAELEARREKIKARPHESWELSNLGANIRRLEARRTELAALKASPRVERMVGAVKIIEDPDLARIQLVYPGKPDEATRDKLKANGFRWAPSERAWQRQLNNAGRYAAERVLA